MHSADLFLYELSDAGLVFRIKKMGSSHRNDLCEVIEIGEVINGKQD
jgi:hypothetical protein